MNTTQTPAAQHGIGDGIVAEFPASVATYGKVEIVCQGDSVLAIPGGRPVVATSVIDVRRRTACALRGVIERLGPGIGQEEVDSARELLLKLGLK